MNIILGKLIPAILLIIAWVLLVIARRYYWRAKRWKEKATLERTNSGGLDATTNENQKGPCKKYL